MLLHVLSDYYSIKLNTKVVQVFGLVTAAYWALLLEIMPRVVNKKYEELTSTGYFTIDRSWITETCGLTVEEQFLCDKRLSNAGVVAVNPDNSDMLCIDCCAMLEIMLEDDAKVLDKFKKKAGIKKTDEAAAKRGGMIRTLSSFSATLAHTPEVQEAFTMWITAMVESKKAKISKPVIQLFYDTMTAYTQDPAIQVEILKQATMSGYTNATWVINSLSRKPVGNVVATHIAQPQKQFAGVADDEVF